MGQISTLEMKLAKAIALLILVSVPALVSAQIKKAKNAKVSRDKKIAKTKDILVEVGALAILYKLTN